MALTFTKDSRPKDWGYIAQFSSDDLPSLQYMARRIRETHDTDMIERLHSVCENDDSSMILDNGKALTILSARKSEDLVVNAGLDQCIKLIQGTSTQKWSHMGWTSTAATSTPSITDTSLPDGDIPNPIPLSPNGWAEARGMKLFFGTIAQQSSSLSPDYITNDVQSQVTEIGVYNKIPASTGSLLNREKFANNALTRTLNPDGIIYKSTFVLSSVIEFCPVA